MTAVLAAIDILVMSARHQIAMLRASPIFVMSGVLQPAVLLLVVFFAQARPSGHDVTVVASAVLLMAYWDSTVWQGAAILRLERFGGTMAALMRCARGPILVLIGKSIGATLAPALLICGTLTATLAALGESLQIASVPWFAAGLLAAIVSGTALGTLLGSIFVLTRHGAQLALALLYPVFLISGLLIPADLVPPSVGWLGWFMSLRWAQQFLVSTIIGSPDFRALGLVGVLTVGYAIAGRVAFRRVEARVRQRGTLELV